MRRWPPRLNLWVALVRRSAWPKYPTDNHWARRASANCRRGHRPYAPEGVACKHVVPVQVAHHGKWSAFWPLNAAPGDPNQFGVKGYIHQHRAERGFRLQQLGYQHHVAPTVGERVQLILEDGSPHPKYPHGYETGVCEPFQGSIRGLLHNRKTLFDVVHSIFPRASRGPSLRIGRHRYAPQ